MPPLRVARRLVREGSPGFKAEQSRYSTRRLVIVTDRLDNAVAKQMRADIDYFCSDEHTAQLSGFDRVTGQLVKGSVHSKLSMTHDSLTTPLSAECVLEVDDQNTSVTIAADVLANSLNWWFNKRRQGANVGAPLHRHSAVLGHPLTKLFYGIRCDTEPPLASDVLFPHPLQHAREEVLRLTTDPSFKSVMHTRLREMAHLRAYSIYKSRSSSSGDDVSDWYQARQELAIPSDLHV